MYVKVSYLLLDGEITSNAAISIQTDSGGLLLLIYINDQKDFFPILE